MTAISAIVGHFSPDFASLLMRRLRISNIKDSAKLLRKSTLIYGTFFKRNASVVGMCAFQFTPMTCIVTVLPIRTVRGQTKVYDWFFACDIAGRAGICSGQRRHRFRVLTKAQALLTMVEYGINGKDGGARLGTTLRGFEGSPAQVASVLRTRDGVDTMDVQTLLSEV